MIMMNARRSIIPTNDTANLNERLATMPPSDNNSNNNDDEVENNDKATATSSLLYSDNIVAVCEAVNNQIPQTRALTEEERHERRLESNRLSARRRRQRHATQIQDLQDQVRSLSSENQELRAEHDRLQALIHQHGGSGVGGGGGGHVVLSSEIMANSDMTAYEVEEPELAEKAEGHQEQNIVVEGVPIYASSIDQPPPIKDLADNVFTTRYVYPTMEAARQMKYQGEGYGQTSDSRSDVHFSVVHNPLGLDPSVSFLHATTSQQTGQVLNPLNIAGDNSRDQANTENIEDNQAPMDVATSASATKERESSDSFSLPGDVSEYFDLLFGASEQSNDAVIVAHPGEGISHVPLGSVGTFSGGSSAQGAGETLQGLTGNAVRAMQETTRCGSADTSSLSSCPISFSGAHEDNVGEMPPISEDIFDSQIDDETKV